MYRSGGLVAMFLVGFLLILGSGGLSPVYAQSSSGKLTEKQWQELQQKRQKEWEDSEKEDQRRQNTYQRRQEADKRQQDAEKRQREAERQLRELQK